MARSPQVLSKQARSWHAVTSHPQKPPPFFASLPIVSERCLEKAPTNPMMKPFTQFHAKYEGFGLMLRTVYSFFIFRLKHTLSDAFNMLHVFVQLLTIR